MSRDEKLKRNQAALRKRRAAAKKKEAPKKKTPAKRKSLEETISSYQKEKKSGSHRPGAVRGQGPVADGDKYGKLLKKNREEDKGGPKGVLAPKRPTSSSGSSGGSSGRSGGGSSSGSSSSSSSSASNKAVKGGYTISPGQRRAGTRGSSQMPSNPQLHSQTTGRRDPESGLPMGRGTPTRTSSNGKAKLINGKLHVKDKNGKWVKARM
jgi:hypothetical protein